MYKIKQIPEDFIVEELLNFNLKEGTYYYFLLTKKNTNTQDAIDLVSKKLKISQKYINFAGTKDKYAVTKQYISIKNTSFNKNTWINKNIHLEYLGKFDERLNLGSNSGNRFNVTVRNLTEKKNLKKQQIVNYFDEQRFSRNNVLIGGLLLKKKFERAASLVDYNLAKKFLSQNPTNCIGSLRKIPKKILKLYIHSFQSFIWNETASIFLKNLSKKYKEVKYSLSSFIFVNDYFENYKIPLVGFSSDDLENNSFKGIIDKLLSEYSISYRNFIIKEIPDITSEGSMRALFVEPINFNYSYAKDELNNDKLKCTLKFELPPGSYATILIKHYFS